MNIIGLDIGTTSVCGIIFNKDSGDIIHSQTRPNNAFMKTEHPFIKQQDPAILINTLKEILEILLKKGKAAAIGVTGQMHGIVYLNASGHPLGPLTIWQDGRGDLNYKNNLTYAQYLTKITGMPVSTGYGAVTHFYNTVNNLIPKGAVTFCTIHDLAVMELTGKSTPLLNPSDAASFGLYDLKNNCFNNSAITAAGMDASFFPKVKSGFTIAGETINNIPVSVAIGDNQASVIGSVKNFDKSILINVGTGSQISCVVQKLPNAPTLDCRPFLENRWLLAGSSLCGGRAYAILEKFLRETATIVSGKQIKSAYPAMDKLMENFNIPQEPLVVNTAFSGTRVNPSTRGFIENIGTNNLTMGNLCHGVMNGMVKELHDTYLYMLPFLNNTPKFLIGSGNGIRFNKPLAQRFSNSFNLPLLIPKNREEAAFGAALFAMVAAKIAPTIDSAQEYIKYN